MQSRHFTQKSGSRVDIVPFLRLGEGLPVRIVFQVGEFAEPILELDLGHALRLGWCLPGLWCLCVLLFEPIEKLAAAKYLAVATLSGTLQAMIV